MDVEADEFFEACLAQATIVAKQVRNDQMALSTPDTEWSVRDLVEHMLYELSWVPDVLSGSTTEEVGDKYEGELLDDNEDVATVWEGATTKAERALETATLEDTVHLSYGDRTAEEYLLEVGTDLLIHAWDLGQAIGVTVTFNPVMADDIYERNKDKDLQATGLFAAPVPVPVDADIQTKLLALYGRDANTWREQNK